MNMKKLLAGVVGVTVLMSNVAFAAVSTTTTYDAGSGKVDVETYVTELTNGSMVTYVLYGNKGKDTTPFADANGAITATTATAPDESNIIYIDQENNVTGGTKTFTAPGLNVGEAYGAKVIVGTDNDTDAGDVAVTEDYTGDMYTLKLSNDVVDYTAKVEVNMGENYIKEYSLAAAGATVKVPVGAQCKVTFEAASGKVVTKALVDTTEITNASNLNPENYVKDGQYVLSAEVQNEVAAPLITVSDPIVVEKSVLYLVNVEHFANVLNTGLKIEFNGNEFDKLVPLQVAEGETCYAIQIIDRTDAGSLGITDDTRDYTVTPFIKVDDDYIYAGSTSAGDSNHFTTEYDETLANGGGFVYPSETQPEDEPTEEPVDDSTEEQPVEEPVAEEEPASEEI